jgi:hypothetical protein
MERILDHALMRVTQLFVIAYALSHIYVSAACFRAFMEARQ